jgi:hypothetical protein
LNIFWGLTFCSKEAAEEAASQEKEANVVKANSGRPDCPNFRPMGDC